MTISSFCRIGLIALVLPAYIHAQDEFFLKHDGSDKTFGPFTFTDGSPVVIGEDNFTIVKKGLSPTEQALQSVILPEVDFKYALLDDTVALLQMHCAEHLPSGQVVNFVLLPSLPSQSDDSGARKQDTVLVHLRMTKATALDVLKAIVAQAGYTYTVSGTTVTISANKH